MLISLMKAYPTRLVVAMDPMVGKLDQAISNITKVLTLAAIPLIFCPTIKLAAAETNSQLLQCDNS